MSLVEETQCYQVEKRKGGGGGGDTFSRTRRSQDEDSRGGSGQSREVTARKLRDAG
jgi:hypothetical protein